MTTVLMVLAILVIAGIIFFSGVGIGKGYDKRVPREVIRNGVLKYIKSDEFIAFERLHFLLELGPKDTPMLEMVLGQLVEEKTIQKYPSTNFDSLYKKNVNVLT